MPAPHQLLEFSREDATGVVELMTELAAAREGWINLRPRVAGGDRQPPPGLFGVFSASGPHVPLCTWVPAGTGRRRAPRQSLGIQHATGTKAAARLVALGLPLPAGWVVTQDHPRRGLVVEAPADTSPEAALAWLLSAADALCPARLTDQWTATVFAGRA